MNEAQLLEAVTNVSGGTFIGIDSTTVVGLTHGKKHPLQGRVTKVVRGSSTMVHTNEKTNAYENAVKRGLIAQGEDPSNFVLSPRSWGERLTDKPVVAHKGKHYLEVRFLRVGEISYEIDGVEIDKNDPILMNMLGMKSKTPEGEQGGLKEKVILRDYKFESLDEVRINGQTIR